MGSSATRFSQQASVALEAHVWPGNIRELENCVMRGLVNATSDCIDADNLQLEADAAARPVNVLPATAFPSDGSLDLKQARERVDELFIRRALSETGDNVSQAAKLLHISRNALMELKKKYTL